MEPEGDESSHPTPKRFKPTNNNPFSSTSSNKDSILTNPILPQELITAILVRLPVKYLLQYKCVSKDWLSLISSPSFIKTHLSFSVKNCTHHRFLLVSGQHIIKHCSFSYLFNESSVKALDLDYPIDTSCNFVRIVGSVNGLICLRVGFNALVLWNPSTRKFKKVANLTRTYKNAVKFKYGFGYDEVHDDYKVVSIFFDNKNRYVDAKIYSLMSDSWRTLDDFHGRVLYYSSGTLVNGKLHWVTDDDGWGIMSIDLVDEKCRKMEQPCYRKENLILNLGVLGSDLAGICNYWRNYLITQAEVWIMKEYGVKGSWTKRYTIKNPIDMLSPTLCMSNEGELLGVFGPTLMFGSTLMIYNSKDDLRRYPEVTNIDRSLEAEHYVESLVSPILQNEPMTQH